jgi:hypothetical protein
MVDDVPSNKSYSVDKNETNRRTAYARGLLLLAVVAGFALLASDCSRSHVQETVTVAPRAAATPAPAITVANSSFTPLTVDSETEAAGDALAHAIVALKARRRDEALRYMNLAGSRLTHLLNRADVTANSNSTRERLVNDLRELEVAERAARRNDYQQSTVQLVSITNELDHLTDGLSPRQN